MTSSDRHCANLFVQRNFVRGKRGHFNKPHLDSLCHIVLPLDCNIFFRFEDKKSKGFKNAQQKFLKSVTARLTVAQVST